MSRLFALLVGFIAMLAPAHGPAAASPLVQTDHLQSRLVANALAAVPGKRLTLGLLLEHDPHWHTYWLNPGDSGLPTEVSFTLPQGVVAEPIEWPQPQRFELAGIANFGYGGRRLVPISIIVPDGYAASSLPVRASARWLICEVECIPGKADYTIELPVAPTADVNARWAGDFASARANVPKLSRATLTVAEEADAIVLDLAGLENAAMPAQWQWFPETTQLVAHGVRPTWQRVADGWQTRWAKSEYFTALPANVALVAVDRDGRARRFTAHTGLTETPYSAWLAWVYGEQTSPLGMACLLGALTALVFSFWLLGRRTAIRSGATGRSNEAVK